MMDDEILKNNVKIISTMIYNTINHFDAMEKQYMLIYKTILKINMKNGNELEIPLVKLNYESTLEEINNMFYIENGYVIIENGMFLIEDINSSKVYLDRKSH